MAHKEGKGASRHASQGRGGGKDREDVKRRIIFVFSNILLLSVSYMSMKTTIS